MCKIQLLLLMGFIYGGMAILTFFTLVWLDPHAGDRVPFIKHPLKRPCLSVNAEYKDTANGRMGQLKNLKQINNLRLFKL